MRPLRFGRGQGRRENFVFLPPSCLIILNTMNVIGCDKVSIGTSLMSSVVETSLGQIPNSPALTLRERSTELRDVFVLSFCNLFILVNKLILLIYMSSQPVDLSHSFEME